MINAAVFDNDPAMDEPVRTHSSRSYGVRPQFCPRCGHSLLAVGDYCSQCGLPIPDDERLYEDPDASPNSRLIALVLCALLGYLGVHRFYVGKIASGILWLCTGGLFGVGWIIDLILIATGNFRDIDGDRVVYWD